MILDIAAVVCVIATITLAANVKRFRHSGDARNAAWFGIGAGVVLSFMLVSSCISRNDPCKDFSGAARAACRTVPADLDDAPARAR